MGASTDRAAALDRRGLLRFVQDLGERRFGGSALARVQLNGARALVLVRAPDLVRALVLVRALDLVRALALASVLALPLAGCGRKGPLSRPPDASVPTLPPGAAPAAGAAPARGPGQAAPTGLHKSFLLDPLIQ